MWTLAGALLLAAVAGFAYAEDYSEEEIEKHVKFYVTHEADEDECELWSQPGDRINWYYKGTLLDGTVFDEGTFEATIGAGEVILGVDYAMRDMCVGERRRMTIQPDWAYGERGAGKSIPPNSVLIFHVQLHKIRRPDGKEQALPQDEL